MQYVYTVFQSSSVDSFVDKYNALDTIYQDYTPSYHL